MKVFICHGIALVWLALATATVAQEAQPRASTPEKGTKGKAFSGRIVDGLGRPVPGVKVSIPANETRRAKAAETFVLTDKDGKYSGNLSLDNDEDWLDFEKAGYTSLSSTSAAGHNEFVMRRKVDWSEATILPYTSDNDKRDRGVRELFGSEEWECREGDLIGFLFEHHDQFRTTLRRLIHDVQIGTDARDWLDFLADPRDDDLFPNGRKYAPEKKVEEVDLVEALKATARQRNFNSSLPEPAIRIDFIKFTKTLDRALIQCGINQVAMTGFTWRFVFRKVGKQWQLCSAKVAGQA